jgi:hypothetical protein
MAFGVPLEPKNQDACYDLGCTPSMDPRSKGLLVCWKPHVKEEERAWGERRFIYAGIRGSRDDHVGFLT